MFSTIGFKSLQNVDTTNDSQFFVLLKKQTRAAQIIHFHIDQGNTGTVEVLPINDETIGFPVTVAAGRCLSPDPVQN